MHDSAGAGGPTPGRACRSGHSIACLRVAPALWSLPTTNSSMGRGLRLGPPATSLALALALAGWAGGLHRDWHVFDRVQLFLRVIISHRVSSSFTLPTVFPLPSFNVSEDIIWGRGCTTTVVWRSTFYISSDWTFLVNFAPTAVPLHTPRRFIGSSSPAS